MIREQSKGFMIWSTAFGLGEGGMGWHSGLDLEGRGKCLEDRLDTLFWNLCLKTTDGWSRIEGSKEDGEKRLWNNGMFGHVLLTL